MSATASSQCGYHVSNAVKRTTRPRHERNGCVVGRMFSAAVIGNSFACPPTGGSVCQSVAKATAAAAARVTRARERENRARAGAVERATTQEALVGQRLEQVSDGAKRQLREFAVRRQEVESGFGHLAGLAAEEELRETAASIAVVRARDAGQGDP